MPSTMFTSTLAHKFGYLRNDELRISQCHDTGSLLYLRGIRSDDLNWMPTNKTWNHTRMYIRNTDIFITSSSIILLDLSFNQFDSEIPKELGSLYCPMIMNLGHNWLFGVISAEIAEAKKLAVLDLSHNELERPIPNMFSSLSLSDINLSNNQLNGSIPELGTLVTFPQSHSGRKPIEKEEVQGRCCKGRFAA
ncbi:hypothetical protein GUJ93_ZPchr0001g31715 [Zizania palustris]|uniref:Brassinosteroid receptor BRI1 island domain-containing protein n=1 Tax=Zizania palustris TaxID=103762 RepID=A0A8J5RZQ8_ZIZPA|nr:hypothetical protein GUJ93_ZPchr0001g31715 [Zizania palustris]